MSQDTRRKSAGPREDAQQLLFQGDPRSYGFSRREVADYVSIALLHWYDEYGKLIFCIASANMHLVVDERRGAKAEAVWHHYG